tara:strand:- start:6579 stop:6752 length:174 start_codon:yes stop_codon:yes gene_type:complete
MSDYNEIKGASIQSVASDPSPLIEGQVWYNTTSQTYKVAVDNGSGTIVAKTVDVTAV